MRYDVGPITRVHELESVIDSLLGLEDEKINLDGVIFHRDSEWLAGIMTEEDIKELASMLEFHGRWYGFDVRKALVAAVEYRNHAKSIMGQQPESYSEFEYGLLRKELVERLSKRLLKYCGEHQLDVKYEGGNAVHFRWK